MSHELPSTPEKDTDRQKVFIQRNNTGNVHPAYLTAEKDEQGRSIVEWFELDTESGKMVQRFKPITEQNLSDEVQETLRLDYEKRLDEEMGAAGLFDVVAPPTQEELKGEVIKTEIDSINEELKSLTENLTEDEQVAVWKYGTAIHDHEINTALDHLKHTYPQGDIAERYRALMQQKIELQNR